MKHKIVVILLIIISNAFVFGQEYHKSVQDKYGRQLLIHINPQTGSAHRVYGLLPTLNQYGFQSQNFNRSSIENLSKNLFSDYRDILGIDPIQTKLSKAETDGKMWFVTYKQVVNGIPVHGTEIGYTIDINGDIVALGADAYQNVNISTVPKMTSDEAVKWARKSFGIDSVGIKKSNRIDYLSS